MNHRHDSQDDAGMAEGPSKTQQKNAMLALQDLGVAMLQLPDAQLDKLVTNEGLREALRDLRRITSHGARKRQAGYVGKLLRDADVAPFRKALADIYANKARDAKAFHDVEQWRDRLIADQQSWSSWISACPAGDTRTLRSLVREAQHEAATAAKGKGRAYRELFKQVRAALQAQYEQDAG